MVMKRALRGSGFTDFDSEISNRKLRELYKEHIGGPMSDRYLDSRYQENKDHEGS